MNLQLPPYHCTDLTVAPGPVQLGMSKTFIKWVFPRDRTDELKKILEEQLGVVDGIVDGKVTMEALRALEANAKSISTLRMYLGLQKINPTIDLIKGELESGAYGKIVIFAIHRDVVEGLRVGLREFGTVTLYGGTRMDSAETNIRKFQTQKSTRVMIANVQSASTSINLTAAQQVLFVEQSFVPADMQQAIKRCHRIGQEKPVYIRFMSVANTIDQHIANIVRRKVAEISGVLEGINEEQKLTTAPKQEKTNADLW